MMTLHPCTHLYLTMGDVCISEQNMDYCCHRNVQKRQLTLFLLDETCPDHSSCSKDGPGRCYRPGREWCAHAHAPTHAKIE